MSVVSCIPVVPSADIEKSLRLWIEGLGFEIAWEMKNSAGKLTNCGLRKDPMMIMLNQRAGTSVKPEDYEGVRFYWVPSDLYELRERLQKLGYSVSDVAVRDYGQTEFFLTDEDGFSHCFGIATPV